MIGYGWGNVCYIVNFPPGEYLLYNKISGGGGEVYYIANIPMGYVYYIINIPRGKLAMRKVYYTTPVLSVPDEGYSRKASCTLNLICTFYYLISF